MHVLEARIDITALQFLKESDIAQLIGPIGDRIKLKSNLDFWRQDITNADTHQKKTMVSFCYVPTSLYSSADDYNLNLYACTLL